MKKNSRMNVEIAATEASDWIVGLSDKGRERLPPGDFWHTAPEIAEQTGWGASKVKLFIRGQLAKGTMERFAGLRASDGGLRQAIWYRMKGKGSP